MAAVEKMRHTDSGQKNGEQKNGRTSWILDQHVVDQEKRGHRTKTPDSKALANVRLVHEMQRQNLVLQG